MFILTGFDRRLRGLLAGVALASVAGAALAATSRQDRAESLVVHEWGTFTSVAGPDGQAVPWRPFGGPSDLPCFVHVLQDGIKTLVPGGLPAVSAKVRMETPVLYFYAPRSAAQTVQVRVSFPQGLITEWYPRANVPPAFIPRELAANISTIDWTDVKVTPDAAPVYPTERAPSHYYAARETDASPVSVNGQREKFLFYRGLADFSVPVTAKVVGDGRVLVNNIGRADIARVVLFENRGGRIGYRIARGPRGATLINAPDLSATFESLATDLERMLIEQGLYAREASAMVATWRDSWFEEGTRLFYFLPQSSVDAILPLEIRPAPARIARAFVGRLEIITPVVQADVERALRSGDLRALAVYGRFIEPIAAQVLARAAGLEPARVWDMLRLVAAAHASETPCR
jgi:hypothetical protein